MKKSESKKTKFLFIISVATLALAFIFGAKGFNKITKYYNSEYSLYSNVNAYVGGDAYNYIINGTYFAGYSALSGACLICSVITFSAGALLSNSDKNKNHECPTADTTTHTSDL